LFNYNWLPAIHETLRPSTLSGLKFKVLMNLIKIDFVRRLDQLSSLQSLEINDSVCVRVFKEAVKHNFVLLFIMRTVIPQQLKCPLRENFQLLNYSLL
jgi:hypothetical protein